MTRALLLRCCALLAVAALNGACLTPGVHAQQAPATDDGTRMVQVRGAWLRVRDEGSGGTPVVLVHGYGSRLETWRQVQPAIAARARTLAFDQRGFGHSERPEASAQAGYGIAEHAADLWALLDAEHIDGVVLVGHSYGASVVLRAAQLHPERVKAVVLVSPFLLDAQKNSFLRWASVPLLGEWLYATGYRDFAGEKLLLAFAEPERFATLGALDEIEANQRLPGTSYAALSTVRGMDTDDAALRYRELAVPLWVVWGEQDRVTPIRLLPQVSAALPDARVVRVAAVGHMPPWERPDAVVDAVVQALDAVGGAP